MEVLIIGGSDRMTLLGDHSKLQGRYELFPDSQKP
jgi:hypothetical protein